MVVAKIQTCPSWLSCFPSILRSVVIQSASTASCGLPGHEASLGFWKKSVWWVCLGGVTAASMWPLLVVEGVGARHVDVLCCFLVVGMSVGLAVPVVLAVMWFEAGWL